MMLKCQGKEVKHEVKGFPTGARKMVCPHEDKTIFAGSSSRRSRRSQLLRHVKAKGLSQQRQAVSEV
jgi:hypothetical protein